MTTLQEVGGKPRHFATAESVNRFLWDRYHMAAPEREILWATGTFQTETFTPQVRNNLRIGVDRG